MYIIPTSATIFDQRYNIDCQDNSIVEELNDNLAEDKLSEDGSSDDELYEEEEYIEQEDYNVFEQRFTLPETKKILNRERTPSLADVANLPWIETMESGVYAHPFRPVHDDRHNHLYIGEASGVKGLAGRQREHEREINKSIDQKRSNCLHYNIYRKSPRISHWATLFLIPDLDTKPDVAESERNWSDAVWSEVRVISYLAEACFATLLGAYSHGATEELRNTCPFGYNLPWWGVCTHSSLTDRVRAAYSAEGSAESAAQGRKVYELHSIWYTRPN
ncbi:hypothetical protein NHQ30_004307 [Ciborinia camelliae]|nr:hypothetical protein NHQ30_004307 [Ciborinia camelliae]